MMVPKMMHPDNKVALNGRDIENLNYDLRCIRSAQETCETVSKTLRLLGQTRRLETTGQTLPFSHDINKFFQDYKVLNGLSASLELVVLTLEEAESNITVVFEEKTEFYEDLRMKPEVKG
jgi:hypothetical protein